PVFMAGGRDGYLDAFAHNLLISFSVDLNLSNHYYSAFLLQEYIKLFYRLFNVNDQGFVIILEKNEAVTNFYLNAKFAQIISDNFFQYFRHLVSPPFKPYYTNILYRLYAISNNTINHHFLSHIVLSHFLYRFCSLCRYSLGM